jgi:AcrR family transcriptional regulator
MDDETGGYPGGMTSGDFAQISAAALDDITEDSTRGKLLRATIELLVEGGQSAARVHRIARKAGMTTGAIYANFASKEELLSEAIGLASLAELRSSVGAAAGSSSAVEILTLLGMDALAAAPTANHPVLLHGLAGASQDGALRDTVIGPVNVLRDTVKQLLAQARDDGDIDPDLDLDALTWLALAITMGSFVLKSLRITQDDADAARAVMERLIGGFGPVDRHDTGSLDA